MPNKDYLSAAREAFMEAHPPAKAGRPRRSSTRPKACMDLIDAMNRHGITQSALAYVTGILQSNISNLLTGKTNLTDYNNKRLWDGIRIIAHASKDTQPPPTSTSATVLDSDEEKIYESLIEAGFSSDVAMKAVLSQRDKNHA